MKLDALNEILLFESPMRTAERKFGISTCSAPKLVKLFLSLGIVIELLINVAFVADVFVRPFVFKGILLIFQ